MKQGYAFWKRKIASGLVFVLAMSNALPIYADVPITKYETVYVNLNADGSQRETIVSNWLKDSRFFKMVGDATTVDDIVNVSSSAAPIKTQTNLEWETQNKDIIYQGRTTKKLPIEVHISYYLNGEEISPEELAGKSGKIEINIEFENCTFRTRVINGKIKKIAIPFTVTSVIGLDSEKFSDISVENAKIFSDGNKQMIVFLGFPGLKQSMSFSDFSIDRIKDIDIPEAFRISADVKDFELSTIAVVASPQLPDMIKDMDSGTGELSSVKQDIHTAIGAKNTLKRIDPTDSIKSLVTDEKKTNDAKLLVDDLFRYYELDTAILDILPNYVTKENIELYDRIKSHTDSVDMDYVLDHKTLRTATDRLDNEQIDKTRILIKDYDEIKDIDMDRLDKGLDVIRDYDNLKPMLDTSVKLYDKLIDNDDYLDTLDKATNYTDRIFDLVDKAESYSLGSSFGSSLTEEDINVMLNALIEKKTKEMTDNLFSDLFPADPNTPLTSEQIQKLKYILQIAVEKGKIDQNTIDQFFALLQATGGILPEPYRTQLMNLMTEEVKQQVKEEVEKRKIELSSSLDKVKSLMNEIKDLQKDMEDDIGYNYKNDLRNSLNFAKELMPDIRVIREEEKKNRDSVRKAIDFARDEADMRYAKHWANRAKEMKDDMDLNEENVDLAKDLLSAYDEPKIREFYEKIPLFRNDMDQLRPILDKLSDDLEIKKYNDSFHKSPETVETLLKMKNDLDDTRYMADILDLSLNDEVIKAARDMIEIIDRRDAKGDLDKGEDYVDSMLDVAASKDAVVELSDRYTTFTGKKDDMQSKLMFVMKIDEIESKEKEVPFFPKNTGRKSFFQWIKGFFVK